MRANRTARMSSLLSEIDNFDFSSDEETKVNIKQPLNRKYSKRKDSNFSSSTATPDYIHSANNLVTLVTCQPLSARNSFSDSSILMQLLVQEAMLESTRFKVLVL